MPAPLNALAINTLQDSVEGLLALMADHLHVTLRNRADFLQLFDAVIAATDDTTLTGFRQAMAAMNTARVGFKHHGNLPSEVTIRRHMDRAQEFMEALTLSVFGRTLDSVGLLTFVRNTEVREHPEHASTLWSSGASREAMESLRLGFDLLVRDFEQRKVWSPGSSLFSTKPSFAPSAFDFREWGRDLTRLVEWVENIDTWVKNLAIGVDMRRYAYFQAHTPTINYAIGGNHFTHYRDGVTIDDEIFGRCFKFVVDTALSFAQDDFDFDPWTARRSQEPA